MKSKKKLKNELLNRCYDLLYYWSEKPITQHDGASITLCRIFSILKEIDSEKFSRIFNMGVDNISRNYHGDKNRESK